MQPDPSPPPSDLSRLSQSIRLPIHTPRGPDPYPQHIIFRGSLMAFHFGLQASGVAHEMTIDPVAGMSVTIPGLIVERGELGGVLVREDYGYGGSPGADGEPATQSAENATMPPAPAPTTYAITGPPHTAEDRERANRNILAAYRFGDESARDADRE